jgi:ribose transport system permease protein
MTDVPVSRDWRHVIRDNVPVLTIYLVLLGLVSLAVVLSPTFRLPGNIFNVLRQGVVLGLISIGQAFVIIAGGIDLSAGSVLKLVNVLTAGTLDGREELTFPVLLGALSLGALIGLVNGLLITRLRVAPFIVTLGMFSILRGIALAYTTEPVGGITSAVRYLYNGQIGPVPFPVIGFAIIFVISWYVLGNTAFGRHVYAVGGNAQLARLSGISVSRIIVMVYVISGTLAATAGLVTTSRMGLGDPIVGEGFELDSITAVVLGGVSLLGGRGSLIGVLAGVLLLGLINNMLNLLGVSQWYQLLVKGIIIVAAVAIYKQKD